MRLAKEMDVKDESPVLIPMKVRTDGNGVVVPGRALSADPADRGARGRRWGRRRRIREDRADVYKG